MNVDVPYSYTYEVDPEFPGNGDWGCPVVGYDATGEPSSTFDSHWGAPFVVRLSPSEGQMWVAMLPGGGLGRLREAFTTLVPYLFGVVVDGRVYLLDVRSPGASAQIVRDPVEQVVTVTDPPLLLFVGYADIVALGPAGIAWRTPRLCLDDLRVLEAGSAGIVCSCTNLASTASITLDPVTGEQLDGPRWDSF